MNSDMMAGYGRVENDGYDTILHNISRYDTIQCDKVPKRSAIFHNCVATYTVYTSKPMVNGLTSVYVS